MPFDLNSSLNKATNNIANKTFIGTILTNPILLACIATIVVIAILNYIEWPTEISGNLVFYLTVGNMLLILIHDQMYKQKIIESMETTKSVEIVKELNNPILGGDIVPRQESEIKVEPIGNISSSGDIDNLLASI